MKAKDSDKHIIAILDSLIVAREQKDMQRKKQRVLENPSFFLLCWYHIKDFFTLD